MITAEEIAVGKKVAERFARRWRLIELEDLEAELLLWMISNQRILERWREEEGHGKLYVTLRRQAAIYCSKESAARIGQPITEGQFYNFGLVDRALPFIFEETPQTVVRVNPTTDEPQGTSNEHNLAVTIISEIRGAFYGLPNNYRELLELRHRDGLTFEEIGDLQNITRDGAKKRVARATERLVEALAGAKDYGPRHPKKEDD